MNSYLLALKNYGNFADRTRRRDFWLFILINNIVYLALLFADGKIGTASQDFTIGVLSGFYTLATTVPLIAVGVRRLHDMGRSGWWIILSLVPLLNLYPFFWFFRDSVRIQNGWGASQK